MQSAPERRAQENSSHSAVRSSLLRTSIRFFALRTARKRAKSTVFHRKTAAGCHLFPVLPFRIFQFPQHRIFLKAPGTGRSAPERGANRCTIRTDGTDLRPGLKCSEAWNGYWTIFDNFHLYYYGSMDEEQVTDIRTTLTDGAGNTATDDTGVYNLQGIKVGDSLQGLPKGIYIVNHRKVIVR